MLSNDPIAEPDELVLADPGVADEESLLVW